MTVTFDNPCKCGNRDFDVPESRSEIEGRRYITKCKCGLPAVAEYRYVNWRDQARQAIVRHPHDPIEVRFLMEPEP